MSSSNVDVKEAPVTIGEELYGLMSELFPIHRSTTGNGVRETLKRLARLIPLEIHEVPTGTQVLDWVVPKEWNINDAYVKNSKGERVIDYKKSNLHIVNTSIPVKKKMRLSELKEYLHTMPDRPEYIPYRYSHYNENWGFCVNYKDYCALEDDEYEVCIDSTLEDGSLTYGECYLPGETEDEVVFECHVCHPSLANDNLSGIAIATFLAQEIQKQKRRFSYRFVFVPATIGAITWLAMNEGNVGKMKQALVLSCLGDPGKSTYKKSRHDTAIIDRAMLHVLEHSGQDYDIRDFAPYGYDERQFNSPGFNIPAGLFMRTPHDCYPQYHSSGDDMDLVKPESLADSFQKIVGAIDILENNQVYVSQNQKGEAHLGRRGLYRQISGQADERVDELPVLWVMNYSDGEHSLLDIAERSGFEFNRIKKAAAALKNVGLLKEKQGGGGS